MSGARPLHPDRPGRGAAQAGGRGTSAFAAAAWCVLVRRPRTTSRCCSSASWCAAASTRSSSGSTSSRPTSAAWTSASRMSGNFDFSTGDPRLAIGIAARNMSAAAFKQMWPAFVNPTGARLGASSIIVSGTVERLEIATNAPLSTAAAGRPAGARRRPVGRDRHHRHRWCARSTGLPPIRDADLSRRVNGRTVDDHARPRHRRAAVRAGG